MLLNKLVYVWVGFLLLGCGAGMSVEPEPGPEGAGEAGSADRAWQEVEELEGWQAMDAGLPEGAEVKAFAHLDGTVYALADAGEKAQLFARRPRSPWVVAGPNLRALSEHPRALLRADRAVYLATADFELSRGSLYRLDAEGGWTRLGGAPDLPLTALARRGDQLWVAAAGLTDAAGVYASLDHGASFQQRGPLPFFGVPARAMAVSAARVLLAPEPTREEAGALFASDDQGASWVATELWGQARAVAALDAHVLVGTEEGAFSSRNFGHVFSSLPFPSAAHAFHLGPTRMVAGLDGAVVFSEDGGATWFDLSAGLPSGRVSAVYVAGAHLWVVSGGRVFAGPVRPSPAAPPQVKPGAVDQRT